MVSKVYPMRSHTVSAEGGAAAVARDDDSFEMHGYDTVKGSDFLGDQDVIQYFVEEAPKELIRLEHWGCPWSRNEDGTVATRAFGGMTVKRTWYATDKVGFHMLHSLFQHSMRFDNIVRYDEYFVSKLLVDGGVCRGVAALDIRTGIVHAILGRAVILATGGAGKIFPFTTNGMIKTGDGMALAYRAGVALKDMEFAQYHPTGLPGTGILITEATRGEGGYLRNSEGARFLVEYDYGVGQKAELGPRDMISRAIIREIEQGRGFQGTYGEYVHLDLTHLGAEKIDSKLPFVRELTKIYVGIDPVTTPIPIRSDTRRPPPSTNRNPDARSRIRARQSSSARFWRSTIAPAPHATLRLCASRRLRPLLLARYSARSEACSKPIASVASSGNVAMPRLTVMLPTSVSGKAWPSTAERTRSATTIAPSLVVCGRMIENSSPPYFASTSNDRTCCAHSRASSLSRPLPRRCPFRSL